MATWTVITVLSPHGNDHIGAVNGYVDVYGDDIHTANVTAATADDAINRVREAFRIVGPDRVTADTTVPYPADRWTAVGLGDTGVCASHTVTAVLVGEHEVHGHRDSLLSHRWTRVVDAPTAQAARDAGYKAAAVEYDDTWI